MTPLVYALSAEQEELRGVVRQVLADKPAARAPYDGGPDGPDLELWRSLADIGIAGLGIDEADGGSGGDVVDQLVVAEEVGRAVAPVPFVGSAVAAAAIDAGGVGERRRAWLADLAAGSLVGGVVLDGEQLAFDAAAASLLVVARPSGEAHVCVDPEMEPLPSVDRTRPLARCRWDGGDLFPLGRRVDGPRLRRLRDTLYAAEAVGVAAAALERAAAYTRDRHQFGHSIGTFQAVKHRLADMLVDVESARSAAYAAAWAIRDASVDAGAARLAVHMAQAVATEAATRVVSAAIQLHGGIGVTWEHDLHLYLRRAKALELANGAPSWHYAQIATILLDRPPPALCERISGQ